MIVCQLNFFFCPLVVERFRNSNLKRCGGGKGRRFQEDARKRKAKARMLGAHVIRASGHLTLTASSLVTAATKQPTATANMGMGMAGS
jgi:hypothetical protein